MQKTENDDILDLSKDNQTAAGDQKIIFFISYSHNDRPVCESIAALFEGPAHDVWYDKGLLPGEIYRNKITDKIQDSDFFIVLLSGASTHSEWVIDEIEFAKKKHKRILPIFIEEITLPDDLDMILGRYHSLFWYLRDSDEQFEEDLERIFVKQPQRKDSAQPQPENTFSEFSEAEVAEMRGMLEYEKHEAYAKCYTAEGAYLLGKAYLYGCSCVMDRKKARFFFRIAQYFGNPDGKAYLLLMSLEDQENATWDDPDEEFCTPVIEELRALSDQGSEAAMMLYANILWHGKYGCQRDLEKSAALYEACAKNGNARAQYTMASNYYLGEGVPKDYDLAIMFAQLAHEQNYKKSWRIFGKFYRDGLVVPQDYEKSRECYEKGAQIGDLNCYNNLGDMYYYGIGCEKDYEKAYSLYLQGEKSPEEGQKHGLRKAKLALGRCLELGHGTDQNLEAAVEKYREGYRLGSNECKQNYLRLAGSLMKQRQGQSLSNE